LRHEADQLEPQNPIRCPLRHEATRLANWSPRIRCVVHCATRLANWKSRIRSVVHCATRLANWYPKESPFQRRSDPAHGRRLLPRKKNTFVPSRMIPDMRGLALRSRLDRAELCRGWIGTTYRTDPDEIKTVQFCLGTCFDVIDHSKLLSKFTSLRYRHLMVFGLLPKPHPGRQP